MSHSHPDIARTEIHGITVLSPTGEFDFGNADGLRSEILEAIGPQNPQLVVDLAATTFLDSMALGVIAAGCKRAIGWGGWLRLVAPQPVVRNVLRTTGLDTVMTVHDTLEQAVQ